jgi:hypothetical protein
VILWIGVTKRSIRSQVKVALAVEVVESPILEVWVGLDLVSIWSDLGFTEQLFDLRGVEVADSNVTSLASADKVFKAAPRLL